MKLKELQEKAKKYKAEIKSRAEGVFFIEGNFYLNADLQTNQTKLNNEVIDLHEGDMIVITPYAKGNYSDHFLKEIAKQHVQLIKLDWYGNPAWEFHAKTRTVANLVRAQILLNEPQFNILRAALIKNLVTSKTQSESVDIPKFPNLGLKPDMNKWIKDVMALEGRAAAEYWERYRKQNDITEIMSRRAVKGKKTTKTNRNASDMVNALLNLGYGILAHKITFALYEWGLEPTIGFYHSYEVHGQRYSLTWDIIEPYRVLIDEIITKHLDEIDDTSFRWDTKFEKRFMMLIEQPHNVGVPTQSAYKEWVNIFTKELPNDYPFIAEYRKILKLVLEKIGLGSDNIRRVLGTLAKNAKPENVEVDKKIIEDTHKPLENEATGIKPA